MGGIKKKDVKKYSKSIYKKGTEVGKKAVKTKLTIVAVILLIVTIGIISFVGIVSFSLFFPIDPVLVQPASPDYDGNIELHWNKVQTGGGIDADVYLIHREYNDEYGGILYYYKTVSTNMYIDTNLPTGTFRYNIIAKISTDWGGSFLSDRSNTITVVVSTAVPPPVKPDKPILGDISPLISYTGIIDLSWNTISTATYYRVYRIKDGGYNQHIATVSTGTTYRETLTLNGIYEYSISAWNFVGGSKSSDRKSVEVLVEFINTPILESIIPNPSTDGYITLKWSYVEGATNYLIYADIDGAGYNKVKIGAISPWATYRTQDGVHSFYIEAEGLSYIAESNVQSVIVAIPVPEPPDETTLSTISPTIDTDGTVELSWTSVLDAISYKLYRNRDSGNYVVVDSTITTTSYTDYDLSDGYYGYKVICTNDNGDSDDSNIRYVTVSIDDGDNGNGDEVPAKTELAAISPTINIDGNIELSWSSVLDAISYKLYRNRDSGNYVVVDSTITTTSYTDYDLSNGYYGYKVICTNADGDSGDSNVQYVTVQLPSQVALPSTPVLSPFTPNITIDGNVILTWSAVSNAQSYKIYRSKDGGVYTMITTVSTNSYTDNLEDGIYIYKIKATNTVGDSVASNIEAVMVDSTYIPPVPPTPPTSETEIIVILVVVVIIGISIVIIIQRFSKKKKRGKIKFK
ncbi:hypothetical protein LCGC14_1105080 [marine sediment metagenome]|uniref:Fibronectin type-III domain-containing protein n=1 Tax=marine sediment metagenome TaxID=412755 RepID=A0A0F9QEN0_9ZZZZ